MRNLPAAIEDRRDLNQVAASLEPSEKMFFKVVAVRAGNFKVVRSSRRKLDSSDVVVTFHVGDVRAEGEGVLVDAAPLMGGEFATDSVHVLSLSEFSSAQMAGISTWTRRHDCQYVLPHFSHAEAASLIRRFFDLNALEGKAATLEAADANHELLCDLEFEGWVIRRSAGSPEYQLSKSALRQLEVAYVVDAPVPILDAILDSQDGSQSAFSLLTMLQRNGWVWERTPRNRSVNPYVLGGPKVFYSSTNDVHVDYLRCLAKADDILPGALRLYHQKKVGYYKRLLEGDFEGAAQLLKLAPRRRALADGEAEAPVVRAQLIADEGMSWLELEDCHDVVEERKDVQRTSASDEGSDSPIPSPPQAGNGGSDVAEAEARAGAQSEAPALAENVGRERCLQPETVENWGEGSQRFRFTWRKPTASCRYGAWQSICPYHRRTAKTKCTKALNLQNDNPAENNRVLRMVQHWAMSALQYDRAWKHQMFNPRTEEVPPSEALLARSETMPMAEGVRDDETLDDLDDAAAAAAGEGSGPAAGRGKRKVSGKSQSRCQAKAKSAPSHSPPKSSESGVGQQRVESEHETAPSGPSSSSSSSSSSSASDSSDSD